MRVERGLGYIVRGRPDAMPAVLGQLRAEGMACLWVTARGPASAPAGSELLRLGTASEGPGTADPRRLGDVRAAWAAFLDAHPGGCLVLDCLDVLTLHHGVERVVRGIAALHDDAATRGANLVVLADPATVNPRLLAWLERELDASVAAEPPASAILP